MKITWNGDWFYANKSYAAVDREIVLGLHRLGHEVKVTNIWDEAHYNSDNEDHRLINSFTEYKFESDYNIFKFPFIHVAKKGPKFNCVLHGDGSYTFSHREYNLLLSNHVTHLFLPTPDQMTTVSKQITVPVIAPGVDGGFEPKMFNPDVEPFDFGFGKDTFKFMVGCDGARNTPGRPFGGYRGTDVAIVAYAQEFSSKDDVCLIIKVAKDEAFVKTFLNKITPNINDMPKIITDFGQDSQEVIARKWKGCDCMLNPIRDCRWEMCCLESIACGVPSIATRCGGPKIYGKKGIYFVEPIISEGDLCRSRGDMPLGRDYWTEPPVEGFRKRMREVYENREEAKQVGLEGSEHAMKHWKWIDMSQRLVDFFNGRERWKEGYELN